MSKRRIRVRIPLPSESPKMERKGNFECCVCMDETSDLPLDISLASNDINNNIKLWCMCYTHVICKGCLHRMVTSFGQSHPIGPEHPFVRCPFPFGSCITPSGFPNYFPHASIERILNEVDKQLYSSHANRYQFPGFELVNCPRPMIGADKCNAGILVDIDHIRTREQGHVIMQCDQTAQCQRKSCYHCLALIGRSGTFCDTCVTATENTNPKVFNHYFYKVGKLANDGQSNLYRNEEITVQLASDQIMEIIQSERMETKCTECLTILMKTEQCNTLDHCGVERCYSCGRSGTRNQKLGDHWDSAGVKGCPRFDHSVYWNIVANCKFICTEGENGCYGDQEGDCHNVDHAQGIASMIAARRSAHVYHALKSLLPEIREKVIAMLAMIPEARAWLPTWKSSDYRTYTPEKVMETLEKAVVVIESLQSEDIPDSDRVTWEFARDFAQKASRIRFDMYPDLPPLPVLVAPKPKHAVIFSRFRQKYAPKRAKIARA